MTYAPGRGKAREAMTDIGGQSSDADRRPRMRGRRVYCGESSKGAVLLTAPLPGPGSEPVAQGCLELSAGVVVIRRAAASDMLLVEQVADVDLQIRALLHLIGEGRVENG